MESNKNPQNLSQNFEDITPSRPISNGQVEQRNLIASRQPSYMRASVSDVYNHSAQKRHGVLSTLIFLVFIVAIASAFIWIFLFDGRYMLSTFPLVKSYDNKYSMLVPFSYPKTNTESTGSTTSYTFSSPKDTKGNIQSINIAVGTISNGNKSNESIRLADLADSSAKKYKTMPGISNVVYEKNILNGKNRYVVRFDETLKDKNIIKKIFEYMNGDKNTCIVSMSFSSNNKDMIDNYSKIIDSLEVN